MLLAIDVGNTNMVFGVFEGERLTGSFRLKTDPLRTSDEIGLLVCDYFQRLGLAVDQVEAVVIDSVVPPVMHALTNAVRKYMDREPYIVDGNLDPGLPYGITGDERLGADRVIIPEQEMGDKLAKSLISSNVLEQIALSEEYSIAELAAPASWVGKTLRALDIRAKYHVSVIALRRGDDITVSPSADAAIAAGDTLVALGTVRDLARVMKR